MKRSYLVFFPLLVVGAFIVKAQSDHFRYARPIEGITDEWHKISLPDELFEKLRADFRDIRIIGVTDAGDTIEAPYIMKSMMIYSRYLKEMLSLSNQMRYTDIPMILILIVFPCTSLSPNWS